MDHRPVTISTIAFLDPERGTTRTIDDNREIAEKYLHIAGERRSDIAVLPEMFLYRGVPNTNDNLKNWAQETPGSDTEFFGEIAQAHSMYIICPLHQRVGDVFYNASVLIDRQGEVVGAYHKTHPVPVEVTEWGTALGESIPVFDTDFGKISMMICFDIYYPELVRVQTLKGAEIVFWSTMTSGPTEFTLETQLLARAIDYNVFMVESNYIEPPPYRLWQHAGQHHGRAKVVDRSGSILADTGHHDGVATATVDLAESRWDIVPPVPIGDESPESIKTNTIAEDYLRCRRPELYGEIVAPLNGSHYENDQ
jgi:predicted amidohydrolase